MAKRGKDMLKPRTPSLALAMSSASQGDRRGVRHRGDPICPEEVAPTQPQGRHALKRLEQVILQGRAANRRGPPQQGPAMGSAAGHKFLCLASYEDC